jgi:ribosomal protein S18 acetylase RimI-like enzyme
MPKIRRHQLPEAVLRHLLLRMRQRGIAADQIVLLAVWLDTNPEVPARKWFKKFPDFTACGEGDLIKTFLEPGQLPVGEELK